MNELEKAKLLNASLELAKSEIRKSLKKINFVTEDGEKPKLIIVEQGERGPRGRDGQQGPIGESGLQGPQGERGEQGPQGKRGERGLIGPRGETGPEGPAGPMGPAGRDGRPSDLKPLEDKLKEDLQGFKQQISAQVTRLAMASLNGGGSSGGGEVRLLNLDDVDADVDAAGADGKALVWNNTTKKFVLGTVSGGSSNNFTTTIQTQAIIPSTNNTFDIGSDQRRFANIFLSSNTIHLGNTVIRSVTNASGNNAKLVVGFKDSHELHEHSETLVANALFQSFVANTNSFIKSQLANTNTRIDNVVAGTGGVSNTYLQAFIANTNNRITNEGILNGIIGGSNIRLSFSSDKLMIQAISQLDNGFISNDFGSLGDDVQETRDFGDIGGRGV